MDKNHLLQDVFDMAIGLLKSKPGQNLQRVIDEAEKQAIATQVSIMQGTVRSKRAAIFKMLAEYQETGGPVRTRWANDYDRRVAARRIKVKDVKVGDRISHPQTPTRVLEVTWVGPPRRVSRGRIQYMISLLVKDPHHGIEERTFLSTETLILVE